MKCLNDKYESVGPDKVKHWYAWLPVAGTVILDDHIQQMEKVKHAGEAAKNVTDKFKEFDEITPLSTGTGGKSKSVWC